MLRFGSGAGTALLLPTLAFCTAPCASLTTSPFVNEPFLNDRETWVERGARFAVSLSVRDTSAVVIRRAAPTAGSIETGEQLGCWRAELRH